MVVFTCNHCGESLKKQAVEKHYQWKSCRGAPVFVSCMDCQKDFRGEEFVAHTKCISEAEKYSGKDYVPKPSQNKGQRKQEAWVDIIQKVLDRTDLAPSVRRVVKMLTQHENVPRKRAKFANFMNNTARNTSAADVNRVFDLIEEAFKSGKEEQKPEAVKPVAVKPADTIATNGNATNGSADHKNGDVSEEPALDKKDKKRKNKKTVDESAVVADEAENIAEEPAKKKRKKGKTEGETSETNEPEKTDKDSAENVAADGSKKSKKKNKKKKENAEVKVVENGTSPFPWKETIGGILAKKSNQMKLTKLQNKLLKAYSVKGNSDPETINGNTIEVVLRRKLKKMKNITIEGDTVTMS